MARRMFLSESAPAMVLGEQPPGPGWREARRVDRPSSNTVSKTRPSSEHRRLELSDLLGALSAAMAVVPLQESAGDAFHRLAELRARAEGIDLREAYRRQSMSTPELWADVRNAAPRGY